MLLKNKLDNIKTLLEADNVLATLEERYCYAKDASNLKKTFKIPDIVVFVEDIEDVKKVVKYANLHDVPIIPRGAGTNMVGACVCEQGGIVLNFSKMNKILEINPINMTATIQPGVVLGDLKSKVEEIGLFYPPDPSNYKVSTVGGSIAQSSGGALSFKYGTTKDYILSLKVVTAEGELMQLGAETTKDAMGYHLNQLIIGSEGTLAIVVEATLKLIPKPEAKKNVIAYFNKYEDAILAVKEITSKSVFPASIDFMDRNSMITVEDFTHCGFKIEFECALLIDLDGLEASMEEQLTKVRSALVSANVAEIIIPNDKEESEKYWTARRSSYAASTRLAPDVLSEDIIVPRDKLIHLIKHCELISTQFNLRICLVGHIGDGNLHPQFVLNLENEEEYRNYLSAKSSLYKIVNELGGAISAEHGIGIEKKSYLENTIDKEAMKYMRLVKKAFDPKNILNPGKIFDL